ncbi:uncharacterized protein CTHT_0039620 [Thermochaetoides thermophila DSM 1495]|uniref:Cardiolipin synthase N-terminal domain-containing protein n=1 Tax=Chaetomium thermophilum (strain DSM 1495 / CBS 144.50 / IMI 039719) TaxID=759272 RepID=G0S4B9_CHATD|nr:hypothetical protein CTHT_0039620 [Thermochaetoides thermophila DSM 1495]EGS22077.1 hypothetical protein CTHT_0039620 [Thermochaetoides thermophila DSM 1495]
MFCSTLLSLFFLQLWLAQLAFAAPAAPISAESIDNSWQYGTGGGILGFVVLILDIIVFVEVLKSSRPPIHKLLWCLVVFFFPVIGLIIYYFFSNRSAYQRGAGTYTRRDQLLKPDVGFQFADNLLVNPTGSLQHNEYFLRQRAGAARTNGLGTSHEIEIPLAAAERQPHGEHHHDGEPEPEGDNDEDETQHQEGAERHPEYKLVFLFWGDVKTVPPEKSRIPRGRPPMRV